jgi:hypothetical protein
MYFFSNPTSTLTDAVTLAWAPLSASESNVYKISDKIKVEDNYKKEALR